MWRVWIGRWFGVGVAAVRYGYSHDVRFVRHDADGVPYVRICGTLLREEARYGHSLPECWIWLVHESKPLEDLKRETD